MIKKLSIFAERLVPDYIREYYPQFVEFVRGFLEFLESETKDAQGNVVENPYKVLSTILDENNFNVAIEKYWNEHKQKYAPLFPDGLSFVKRILFGVLKPFYEVKGTEASVRFLYKLFFQEDIDVQYPSDYILSVSGGEWYQPTVILFGEFSISPTEPLRVGDLNALGYKLTDLIGAEIEGTTSKTRGVIDGFGSATYGNTTYFTMYIVDVVKDPTTNQGFVPGEALTVLSYFKDFQGSITPQLFIPNTTFTQQSTGTQITLDPRQVVDDSVGIYRTQQNLISGVSVMQDNYYYQLSSYVIRSGQPFDVFNKYIKPITHPAGLIPFGTYSITIDKSINSLSNKGSFIDGILINKITPINEKVSRNITIANQNHIVASMTYGRYDKQKNQFPYTRIYRVGDLPPNMPISDFQTKANLAFPYTMGIWLRLIKPIYLTLTIPISPFTAGRLQSSYSLRQRTMIGTISGYQINQFTNPNLVINVAHPPMVSKIINNAQPVPATIGTTTTGAIDKNKFVPGTPYYTMPIGAIGSLQIQQFNNPNNTIQFANTV